MKSKWSRIAKALYTTLLLASAAIPVVRSGMGVESDVLALAGESPDPDMQSVADVSAASARVLVEGKDMPDVLRGAEVVRDVFQTGGRTGTAGMLEELRGRTDGLLDPETRALIMSGRTETVRELSEARLFGIAPPLFSVKDDPMLLASAYVESLGSFIAPGWSFRDGMPVKSDGKSVFALVAFSLAGRSPRDVAAAMDSLPEKLPKGVTARFSGAPFHAARSASRAEREIGVLSAVSLFFVLFLGWRLFRSFAFIPSLAFALAAGCIVATGALFAVWPRPHVLVFVFGTSLIGLSVDYVYHARSAGGAGKILKPLTQSFATTLVSFAPLLFADIPVLRQMALFTMAGLAAVYAGVLIFGWHTIRSVPDATGFKEWTPPRFLSGGCFRIALTMSAGAGLFFASVSSDPAGFYRPDDGLAADEKYVAESLSLGGTRIVNVRANSLQEALEREENAGVPYGLSKILPSLARQRGNAGLVARLYRKEGAAYSERTGLKCPVVPERPRFIDPSEFSSDSVLGTLVGSMWTGRGLVSPCPEGFVSNDPDVRIMDVRAAVEDTFRRVTDHALRLAGYSAFFVAVLLAVLFRRRFLRFAFRIFSVFVATAGVTGWLGMPFTIFTLLAFFVLAGLGLDYMIFHGESRENSAGRSVLFAFLTSFAGLGMLSFTAFPVTRDMGITFAAGLLFAYFFSFDKEGASKRVDKR